MKRISIPASPNDKNPKMRFSQEVIVVLPDDLADKYDAAGKEFPDQLPNEWVDPDDKRSKRIDWITNFELTQGGASVSLPAGKKYQIFLPASSRKYVYFNGKKKKVIKLGVSLVADSSYVVAEFTDADPPIGMT